MSEVLRTRKSSCTDRETLLKLGLWDIVFDEGNTRQKNRRAFFKFLEMGYSYPDKAFNWKYLLNLFSMDIIPDLKSRDRQIKPWLSNKKDLEDELLKLGIRLNLIIKCLFDENLYFSKKDLNLGINTDDKPIYLDVINNPVDRVILSF